ncbi:MAG: hypothetical protein ABSH22_07870 [Tepidisphaeraceae bacterium]
MAAATLLVLMACIAYTWSRFKTKEENQRVVAAFSAAQLLSPVPKDEMKPGEPRTWDQKLQLANGIQVRIEAMDCAGGNVTATYADDQKWLEVANAGDYVYPKEIRINPATERLFVLAEGVAMPFGWHDTQLFEFDLRMRKQLGHADMDPAAVHWNVN